MEIIFQNIIKSIIFSKRTPKVVQIHIWNHIDCSKIRKYFRTWISTNFYKNGIFQEIHLFLWPAHFSSRTVGPLESTEWRGNIIWEFFYPPKKSSDLESFPKSYSKCFKHVHNLFLGHFEYVLHVLNIYLILQRFFRPIRADWKLFLTVKMWLFCLILPLYYVNKATIHSEEVK